MAKVAPLLFVLAAVIVAGVFLLGDDDAEGPSLEIGEEYEDETLAPGLRTSDAARPNTGRRTKKASPTKTEPKGPPRGATRFLHGVVVDAATGKPVAGATLQAEHAGEPCPRLPYALSRTRGLFEGPQTNGPIRIGGSPARFAGVQGGDDGRFNWMVGDVRMVASAFDVFTRAPGYVTNVLCTPRVGDEVTIRLERAVPLEITVTDRHGRPIEYASLVVRPGPETERVPGHAGVGTTDENGRGIIDGLSPGEIVLSIDHPEWMPTTTEPFDPALAKTRAVALRPALRVHFTIRSDDGRGIAHPSLAWRTDGQPPHQDLLLLDVKPNGPEGEPTSEVISEAVRIPCDHATVHLEITAEGFSGWKRPEPIPAGGGEREVIVVLTRDTALGSLEIVFRGPDGKTIEYSKLGSGMPNITPLDDIEVGPVTIERGASLWFKSLPAGRYRIGKSSPDYAPGEVDVEVRAGEPTRATMKLRAAAKLRVRFLADARHMVQFRLLRGTALLPAFPVRTGKGGPQDPGTAPLSARGSEGALFTGLPGGACTIEVTSPDLVATRRTVQLQEGETTDVEIEVRER